MASLNLWLETFADTAATRSSSALRNTLLQNPARASYSSISDVARMAGVNIAAVTRTAQSWGFAGWPALREELRSRYLESLSLADVTVHRAHRSGADPIDESMDADRRGLLATTSGLRSETLREVVTAATGARLRISLGISSYRSIADLLATYFTVAGYPTSAPSDVGGIATALTALGPGDLVIAFDFWRGYALTIDTVTAAHENGATTCLVTDHAPGDLGAIADHVIRVPSESSTFLPSLVPAVAVINALAAELALRAPATTEASFTRFEDVWRRMRFAPKPN